MNKPAISIVIPLFNEEASLGELHKRISQVLKEIGQEVEVIYVNDGSTDDTGAALERIAAADPTARIIHLSRNFGHQPALTAGIDSAVGEAVILMDGDLQDQPEAIPGFVEKWREGYEVVYAVRSSRQENGMLRLAFKAFYWVQHKLSGIQQPLDAGIFCLLDRRVVNVLKTMPERNRYFPGLRAYAGFKQVGLPVDRDARFSGASRVRLTGLIQLAMNGILSFSMIPLRIASLLGATIAFCSFGYMLRVLYKKLVTGEAILGWASTLTGILFLGGIQMIILGLLGEYIGRIYEEVKRRPYYVVDRKINFPNQTPSDQPVPEL